MISKSSHIYVAVPALDEWDHFPAFLDCIKNQTYTKYTLYVCVNQPDAWWGMADKLEVCENNRRSLEWLKAQQGLSLVLIDKSSPGRGWTGKKSGVGWARRTLMDTIDQEAANSDLIISLDVDTTFDPGYFQSVVDVFSTAQKAVALSNPYYHRLTGDEEKDRAILRYEIFMRYYVLNLRRIGSPYSFTAIGSAIALPVKAYRAIGGITPHKSGEDFYLLQKLRKGGGVITRNTHKVYPAARYSDRVGFGTGPAMIRGRQGDWLSYPLYPHTFFDEVRETYDTFPALFEKDTATPMDAFIRERFGEGSIWEPLRRNARTQKQFIRSCHQKIDAFRILQFLKRRMAEEKTTDERAFLRWFQQFYPEHLPAFIPEQQTFSLSEDSIPALNRIRDFLAGREASCQEINPIPEIQAL